MNTKQRATAITLHFIIPSQSFNESFEEFGLDTDKDSVAYLVREIQAHLESINVYACCSSSKAQDLGRRT